MSLRTRGASVASAIVLTLGLGLAPMPALAATSAELQAELDQAEAQLHSLYSSAEQANNDLVSVTNDLNETNAQIDQLETDIADQQVQLADTQKQLGNLIAMQYKGGEADLLTLLLNSADFNELITNVHYASSIADQKQEAIDQIKTLTTSLEESRASLEEQKTQQEQLVSDQQAKTDEVNAAAADAQAYYDQLSDEVANMMMPLLGLEDDMYDDFAASVSGMMVSVYGVAIVKPAEGKTQDVVDAMDAYVQSQQKSMEHYLEDQYQIASAARVATVPTGEVVMVCCEDSDTVFENIKKALAA